MLRCTHCGQFFDLQKEFTQCPECKIGTLVGGDFTMNGLLESEIRAQFEELNSALESFGVTQQDYEEAGLDTPDDFYNSGYIDESEFHQPNLNDIVPEHPNCPCHSEPIGDDTYCVSKFPGHLDFLTIGDLSTHEFMCYTLDPISKEDPKKLCGKMGERFTRTFKVNAAVPVGQRNS